MSGPWIKVIASGQRGDGKSEHQHFRNEWTGKGKFNSDDHYIYYYGQESLRRNEGALIINKTVWNAVLSCNLKNDSMFSIWFHGKPFNITVMQVYPSTTDAKEDDVDHFCEDLEDLIELKPKKNMFYSSLRIGIQK